LYGTSKSISSHFRPNKIAASVKNIQLGYRSECTICLFDFSNLLFKFNNEVKHPPITQFFKIVIIEYERRNYCADIIFTDWNADINYADISKENCGKKHLDNWNYKNYIKDYKIMGELFKNKLEFLEWYIGFELTDLLHNSGFDKIKKLGTWILNVEGKDGFRLAFQ